MFDRRANTVEVGCAVIAKAGKILIARRSPGVHLGGYWEFPGGKRHPDEAFEACLIREVREELGIEIRPRRFLTRTRHDFPHKTVILYFFLCDWTGGRPAKIECFDFRWVEPVELRRFSFPLPDTAVVNDLIRKERYYFGNQSYFSKNI